MALTVFQEQVPFTNQRVTNQVSSGTYYNPIVMPLSFNVVNYRNFVEVIFYIRNDDPSKFYNNIIISLVKIDKTITGDDLVTSIIYNEGTGITFQIGEDLSKVYSVLSSSENNVSTINVTNIVFPASYDFVSPINSNNNTDIDVKFSYGYDELSDINWDQQKEMLFIPYIGTTSMYDMSYIPIRMRIELKAHTPVYTLRDYSLDISYSLPEGLVGA